MEGKTRARGVAPDDTTPRPTGRGQRGGFSLAELLISIGILSIGLGMTASLFPAAIKETERSMNNALGMAICGNALALGKVILTADNPDGGGPNDIEATSLVDCTSALASAGNLDRYPSEDTNSSFGCVLFARKLSEGSYQLVAVAYRKTAKTNAVSAKKISSVTISKDTQDRYRIVTSTTADLRLDSPLIVADTGDFAKLVEVSENLRSGTLDHSLPALDAKPCWVIQEANQSRTSPAIWVLSTKTGLRVIR